jgi:hypothetical protein
MDAQREAEGSDGESGDGLVRRVIFLGVAVGQSLQRAGRGAHLELTPSVERRCADAGGFSLHADVCVPARDTAQLECLPRYVARAWVEVAGPAEAGWPVRPGGVAQRFEGGRIRAPCLRHGASRARLYDDGQRLAQLGQATAARARPHTTAHSTLS